MLVGMFLGWWISAGHHLRRKKTRTGGLETHNRVRLSDVWVAKLLQFLWPVCSQFDPDDVPVFRFFASSTVVAEPAPIRHSNVQAIRVKSCRTGFTTEQLPSCNTSKIKLRWKAFPGLTHHCGTMYPYFSWDVRSRLIKTSTHPPHVDLLSG